VRISVSELHTAIENQNRVLRQIAERRGWTVVEVYTDEGVSGASTVHKLKREMVVIK
jgi:hypothetical protein